MMQLIKLDLDFFKPSNRFESLRILGTLEDIASALIKSEAETLSSEGSLLSFRL